MTNRLWRSLLYFGSASLLALNGVAFSTAQPAGAAASAAPPGPDRSTVITVDYTAYEWWVASWNRNQVVCSVTVDHKGQPTLGEVYTDCGEDVYDTFVEQKPCLGINTRLCSGYYMYLVGTSQATKEVSVALPPPVVWLSLEDCSPIASAATTVCEYIPKVVLTGEEPLPNEHIVGIDGSLNGEPFSCDPVCKLELQPTGEEGADLEFWAWSSYGDSSVVFSAQVRVVQVDLGNPDAPSWYVDVLSSQWQGMHVATCADTWQSFPPVGGPPKWLSTPRDIEDLSSDIPYEFLSANLILQGVVDASYCPDGGLDAGGGVNTCGLEAAREAVNDWQDRFDTLILNTAHETGVPAQLLKNLFARESQFWPGIFKALPDAGLGQLTENGADTALLWNPSFYKQYCPLVLSEAACSQGYLHLDADQQELLRQALVGSVNASCEDCPLGIDLSQADFSVNVFAHTMLANCEQTSQVIYNVTGNIPGEVASYEDLWKFTLINYNAGAGCLALAASFAWDTEQELTWDNVSGNLTEVCKGAKPYVEEISR
jgi:hypothetical protein